METTFSAYQWLQLLSLGGVAGMLGQGARTVIGFKKLHDASSTADSDLAAMVQVHRLIVSLAIGFIAGALGAATTISTAQALDAISLQQVLALAAIGYAGTDAIEGIISRVAPASDLAPGQEGIGSGPPAAADDGTVG
jgi:hypothetical protein